MADQKTNYWPQSIAALLFAAALLIVWTVIQTSQMPVHEENNFMKAYQNVDLNADEILRQNREFFKEYDVDLISKHTKQPIENEIYKKRNRMTFKIDPTIPMQLQVDAKEGSVADSSMQVLLTRPTTTVSDKQLQVRKQGQGRFVIDLSAVDTPGRWQLVTKTTVSEKSGYKNFDLWIDE